ncbi:D-arabinitol 2-dehydrogenase [ribulose-forming]-like protein [Emericellopsis cladophorae]|uniref:D-arabinitol 2-dehydrogenase [ribulose-forming]-like protein n=1 Tax=Emericellopsis cladophorae TaxID=2686198 RepID=A0A9P9XVN3_9HYPO|nr:D-arabinitol 2-dehydrogenase [ribulose-forming]-like protein [Emericellopsis cladophorae]KAI6778531.1 D-arabinitol 2-dehydrogenase [ribulose-forming]-like protein [Emericellopsis cladophorae]
MLEHQCNDSICLVASISGSIANKGLVSPVYNSSKAAVIQLVKNRAIESNPVRQDGSGGIRIDCLSPRHILMPMVAQNPKDEPDLKDSWCRENIVGRLADIETSKVKSAARYLLSKASSFMTGKNLVVDGDHTVW